MAKRTKQPSPEQILEALKTQHGHYMARQTMLQTELNEIQIQLSEVSDLVTVTEDAINALEGKPTLKKMLEAALVQANTPASQSFDIGGPPNVHPSSVANPKNLPAPEPGFKWVVNDIGQDVLVPIDTPEQPVSETAVGRIALPIITEDSKFDNIEDVL